MTDRDSFHFDPESPAWLSTLLHTTPAMIAYIDGDETYRFANLPYCSRFGLMPEDVTGRHIQDVLGGDAYQAAKAPIQSALSGKPAAFHKKIILPVLGARHMHARLAPVTPPGHAGVNGLVAVVTDITEQKNAEQALQQANGELSRLNAQKTEFLALLAHELRNPLAAVTQSVNILSCRGKVEEKVVDNCIATLSRQTHTLDRLVEDLLDITRINKGLIRLRMGAVDLCALADRAAESVLPQALDKHQRLDVQLPSRTAWVEGDDVRLHQVIVNLLVNAVKYTDDGGRISLSLERTGGQCVLKIADTGIGLSPAALERIFEPFTQEQSDTHKNFGGLGIGLTLVKRLVELHHGTIGAYSKGPGQGAEFVVTLPAGEPPTE